MKLFKKKDSQKGFTLIEMVIVIAIMGVLIAMLLPNLMGFWESSEEKSCESSAKMLQSAVTGYIASGNVNGTYPNGEISQQDLITGKFIVEEVTCDGKEFHYEDGKVVLKATTTGN
jgi:prepilin-type N-terminal cleavage/methylation domain-containing protein